MDSAKKFILKEKDLKLLNSKKGLQALLLEEKLNPKKAARFVKYENRIEKLQEELLKMQQWVVANGKKVVIVFEGRDAAGKGGAIRRMCEHLNPREYRVVALPKPDEVEQGQWYFQRYINQMPKKGEIVFFDRSWYNRAVVEPVNGFCDQLVYQRFLNQVNEVERMLLESEIFLLKIYFSITKKEQARRFKDIVSSPIKRWKYSDVDKNALALWDEYTRYKEVMFERSQEVVKWKVIKANKKTNARVRAMEYVLKSIPYKVKDREVIKHRNVELE
jgi:polyphosphate kinase 2